MRKTILFKYRIFCILLYHVYNNRILDHSWLNNERYIVRDICVYTWLVLVAVVCREQGGAMEEGVAAIAVSVGVCGSVSSRLASGTLWLLRDVYRNRRRTTWSCCTRTRKRTLAVDYSHLSALLILLIGRHCWACSHSHQTMLSHYRIIIVAWIMTM